MSSEEPTEEKKRAKLTDEERYSNTRNLLKEADRRYKENRRAKFALLTPEEREAAKAHTKRLAELADSKLMSVLNDLSSPTLTICVDMFWDGEHADRERRSLCKQLSFIYGLNKKMERPVRLVISGINAEHNPTLHSGLSKQGVLNWKILKYDKSIWEYQDEEARVMGKKVIILSPDATTVLQTLDENSVSFSMRLMFQFPIFVVDICSGRYCGS